jgi:RNA polymerase sigma factor (sigma-70 family)
MSTRASIFLRLKADETASREIAWNEFREQYAPVIDGFARKLGVRTHDIDDIIQDVMLGFFSQSPKFVYDPSVGRFRGYLKVCTFRAMKRRAGLASGPAQVPLEQIDPQDVQVEHAWNDVWQQQRLQRALESTRRQYKNSRAFQAFEMHVIRGLSVEEVSRALGVSASTVHHAKSAVAAALKMRLDDLIDAEG